MARRSMRIICSSCGRCPAPSRTHPAGGGDGIVDRLQHLGRLEPLPGNHRPEAQPICDLGQRRASLVPRLRRPPRGRAARSAGDLHSRPPPAPRYPHLEWAFANGYSNKYGSSGWASYDRHFFRWAERAGFAVDLASQHELQFNSGNSRGLRLRRRSSDMMNTGLGRCAMPSTITSSAAGASPGSPEISCGKRAWSAAGKAQVCYKYRARAEDPVFRSADPAPHLRIVGSPGNRAARRTHLRAERHRRPLRGLGRLRPARRARFPRLSARALGIRRNGSLLRRLCSARTAMPSATRSMDSITSSATACPSRARRAARPTGSPSWRSACRP